MTSPGASNSPERIARDGTSNQMNSTARLCPRKDARGSIGAHMHQRGQAALRVIKPASILIVIGICSLWAVANVVLVTAQWEFDDIHAYVGASQRLVDGAQLYVLSPDLSDTYFYAPWFAYAWIPFAGLPSTAVEIGWAAILVAGLAAALLPFSRSLTGVALALLLGGLLCRTAGWGNVQPLVVAALIYAAPTRAGPWVVGIASSLKPWPILAVAVYAWRREWRSAAISVGVAAALWLPILFFNWTDYPAGARAPNIYDATFLLAVPALLNAGRRSGRLPAPRAGNPPRTRAAGAG
jgi:Glycosyltransferase family 87